MRKIVFCQYCPVRAIKMYIVFCQYCPVRAIKLYKYIKNIEGYGLPFQGPVVQNIVGLMSSLVVKMLTVPVSTISNSQVFLLKKM